MSKVKFELPAKRENTIQAVIDVLIENGITPINADLIIHTNAEALGNENRNIMNAAQDDDWDAIWNFIELYLNGDLW